MPLCSLACRLSPICVLLLSALVRAQVWYDNRASDLTKEGMLQGIERAAAFILFLSADVLKRSYCQMEIRHALALKKPLVLLHGECERVRARRARMHERACSRAGSTPHARIPSQSNL